MSDVPTSGSSVPPLLAPRAALCLGGAILLGMGGLVALFAWDGSHRASLESTAEITAVSDTALYPAPSGLGNTTLLPPLVFQGRTLTPISRRWLDLRDTRMVPVGTDESGTWQIYRSSTPVPLEKGEAEARGLRVYYMKVAPNEYLRVQ